MASKDTSNTVEDTGVSTEPEVPAGEGGEVQERYPFTRENGLKIYSIKGTKFELPEKYTVTARLGQGSYGMVVQVLDRDSGEKYAVKKCGSIFKYPEDGKRILREIKLMQIMNHRNILTIQDVIPPTDRTFEEVYMVTPCLDTDLSNIIRSQTLSEGHCKYIIYQILRGLKYIHSANVLHRDLKPANILINFDCRIKICDFGLARGADPSRKQNLTNYVVTRWYRAPELLLDNTRYNSAIDIWASGCIFAEMLRGSAIFPGESSLDQMHRVADAIGVPADDDLWWIQSSKAREYLKSRSGKENHTPAKELRNLIPADTKPLALDFIQHMLAFNPYKRWSADWLLDHPYLADCHRPESCSRATCSFKWKWDSDYPDEQLLRKLFWKEMAVFHPEIEHTIAPLSSEDAEEASAPAPAQAEPPLITAQSQPVLRDQSINIPQKHSSAGDLKKGGSTQKPIKVERPTPSDIKNSMAAFKERSVNVISADEKALPGKMTTQQEAFNEVRRPSATILHTMHATMHGAGMADARRILS